MKPIIGIIARPYISEEKNMMYGMYEDLINAIDLTGGIPICILPNDKNFEEIISKCDGIIFQGGDNYLNYERKVLEYVYKNNIPTLGICLGMQLMGILFKGCEYGVPNHKSKEKFVHTIYIDKNSKLYEIINEEKIIVNSRHKSTIKNTNLTISAKSSDGIIEAVEDKNKKFFIGVQWHPESMTDYDNNSIKIFKYFIEQCKNK